MTRNDLIEAGALAIMGLAEPAPGEMEGCRSLAEDVIDAIEPLIYVDLRAKVEVLAGPTGFMIVEDVLALLDEVTK